MAIGTSFKQQCPSCEAMVSVKDVSMVGKKVECPKCKDKFIIQPPPKKKVEEDEDEIEAPKSKPTAKTAPAKPASAAGLIKSKLAPKKQTADADDEEENGNKPAGKTKTKAKKEEDEDDGKKKKKKAGVNRFTMGIALGVVGFVVLAAAFYFIFLNKGSTSAKGSGSLVKKTGPSSSKGQGADAGSNDVEKEVKDNGKEKTEVRKSIDMPTSSSFGDLTNLLPKETDHVAKISVKALFRQPILLQEDLFHTPDGLKESLLKEKLGFSLQAIEHVLRADHYGPGGWSFTVLHFQAPIEQEAVKKALGLKPAPDVNKLKHYQVTAVNPWFEQLARLAVGVPRQLRAKDDKRSLFVHFHDSQTILCADEAPMVALLKADKRLKSFAGGEIPTRIPTGSADSSHAPTQDPWATIKPALKSIMERMEPVSANARDLTFFCSATDMEAAQLPTSPQGLKGKTLWFPRQIWDVTLLLQEPNPRIRMLGVALLASASGTIELRNEILCPLENDARALETELAMDVAPSVARFLERILALKVAVPKKEEPPGTPPPAPVDPAIKAKAEPPSKITVKHKDKSVDFVLDMKFSSAELSKLHGIAALMACGLNAEIETLAAMFTRHDLAKAVKSLSEKGLAERTVPAGQFPPGAFLHAGSPAQRFMREPMQRVSWMAGLLPFLGQDTVYGKINFKDSWRGPSNWLAAATLVPQFVDPTYPPSSFYVAGLGLPLQPAATHYVGIAGVGLDAADYDPADPANANKRGVMGYNQGLSLEDIAKGHGLSNTIVMMQVPPDSINGVTPWMAGGGSTLRGVPDQNSVEPFVFNGQDASGKTTRRGTYALMADGSVRFIDPSVSDEVFKAMATATSPLPDGYNPDAADSKTPKVVDTKRPAAKTPAPFNKKK